MTVRLNIGAGDTKLDGWIPIDRKIGREAYPLPKQLRISVPRAGDLYAEDVKEILIDDNTVDEIRASHVLEHFSFADAQQALEEWVRVLKPGCRIRLSVPDVDKCTSIADHRRLFYLMGGQTDADDFHRSAYDEPRLRAMMEEAGLENIQHWESKNTDCAALPISLNLEGIKRSAATLPIASRQVQIKIKAYMTVPRYEATSARAVIEAALKPLGITLVQTNGVYYGKCMQNAFNDAIESELDWILTIDSDSLFSAEQVSTLLHEFGAHPEANAMAALQCRRGTPFPLMTAGHSTNIEVSGEPILATTAHFGLTLIHVEDLKEVPKPWFVGKPDANGDWGPDSMDPDIWFWHQWRLAGKTVYVAPRCSIGHLEETVAMFDEKLQPQHIYVSEWRKRFLDPRLSLEKKTSEAPEHAA